jgi:hypothetical protein
MIITETLRALALLVLIGLIWLVEVQDRTITIKSSRFTVKYLHKHSIIELCLAKFGQSQSRLESPGPGVLLFNVRRKAVRAWLVIEEHSAVLRKYGPGPYDVWRK